MSSFSMPMLQIDNLSFSFKGKLVLDNISLKLSKGEIGSLIGYSGSGKTTLFKLLTGLLPIKSGTFSVNQQSLPHAYQNIGYMTQNDLLLSWRTVWDNLMLIWELGKHTDSKAILKQEAKYYLREVGLEGWENAYPDQLSGGMRQRVSLARVLLQKKPVLLLDEPFAGLDIGLREQMHTLLKEICNKYKTTIFMVTHDFRDALSLSNHIFLLSKGQVHHQWHVTDALRSEPNSFVELYEAMKIGLTLDRAP